MKIAVEGCAHGELEIIYETLEILEKTENIKIDLLLCCGDFQASRNEDDLRCMAVPPKYYNICSFYKYFSGEKIAPFLTVLIGGNHEASNYLQELPYGGWVAPNIFYLGYAGVINISGIRIAGLSGIYKSKDYMKGHFEVAPYDESSKRSVYHVRNLEVFRLKQMSSSIDIFLSHDWPTNVTDFGNKEQLIRFKPHFQEDIKSRKLGSEPCEELLMSLKPKYWFAAHLHCKFAAVVPHPDGSQTKFLALDKCLPKRRFLQVFEIPHEETKDMKIEYDLEWLTILVLTNHLLSTKPVSNYMPGAHGSERYKFTPTTEEKLLIMSKLDNNLYIPENFAMTADAYNPSVPKKKHLYQPSPVKNPQTATLCELLCIDDPVKMILHSSGRTFNESNVSMSSNLSFNTSCSEETDEATSFIDDTILEEQGKSSSQNSSRIISSLTLPEPKNDSESLFFIDTKPSEIDISVKRSCEGNEKSGVCKNEKDSVNSLSNSGKKFKRRNIEIYKCEEGD